MIDLHFVQLAPAFHRNTLVRIWKKHTCQCYAANEECIFCMISSEERLALMLTNRHKSHIYGRFARGFDTNSAWLRKLQFSKM